MDALLQNSIFVFETLRRKKYLITIEEESYEGSPILLKFSPEHYHHLIGFQHLTDRPFISNPTTDKRKFYSDFRNGRIDTDQIISSVKFAEISDRILHFDQLLHILDAGAGRVIIEFNPTIPNSKIIARFCLFRRDETSALGNNTYYNLFIGYNSSDYYPATYLVEHSNRYIREQTLLNCKIEHIH